ncbi:MAG: ATP-binding protein [Acidiferrobacterales bacterium]
MRLLPNSLFGRLALILLSGLILAQLVGTALEFRDRGKRMFQASGLYSAERIAAIVRLLDDVNITERERLVSILNVPTPRVSLTTPAWSAPEKKIENWPTVEFRNRLARSLGERYALRVAVSDKPASDTMSGMHKFGDHGGGHMKSMSMAAPDALIFFAQVKLTDGTWVTFENRINEEIFADSSVLLLTLAILLATVLLVSLLAVRLVTRPLTMLAQAADKLGGDINQPPLPETGPVETRHAAQAFNAMQLRLQRFIEDRTRLLSAISHDLKTPITRMRLRAEMLDDPEQRTSLIENLDEMQAIASETLDFLRADDSRESLQAIDVCVLLETIKDDGAELGQDIKIDSCQLAPFRARPLALKRCIVNLVDNAIKYGGNARVAASENKETLVITVSDTGPGIPEQKLETVFEPFYRLESSRSRETGGTGLGLSIARSIALSHGGDLQLHNISHGGLKATLTLPRRPL